MPFRSPASINGCRCFACGLAWPWRHHGHGFVELESQFVVWCAARQRLLGCGLEKLDAFLLASEGASRGTCDSKSSARAGLGPVASAGVWAPSLRCSCRYRDSLQRSGRKDLAGSSRQRRPPSSQRLDQCWGAPFVCLDDGSQPRDGNRFDELRRLPARMCLAKRHLARGLWFGRAWHRTAAHPSVIAIPRAVDRFVGSRGRDADS